MFFYALQVLDRLTIMQRNEKKRHFYLFDVNNAFLYLSLFLILKSSILDYDIAEESLFCRRDILMDN